MLSIFKTTEYGECCEVDEEFESFVLNYESKKETDSFSSIDEIPIAFIVKNLKSHASIVIFCPGLRKVFSIGVQLVGRPPKGYIKKLTNRFYQKSIHDMVSINSPDDQSNIFGKTATGTPYKFGIKAILPFEVQQLEIIKKYYQESKTQSVASKPHMVHLVTGITVFRMSQHIPYYRFSNSEDKSTLSCATLATSIFPHTLGGRHYEILNGKVTDTDDLCSIGTGAANYIEILKKIKDIKFREVNGTITKEVLNDEIRILIHMMKGVLYPNSIMPSVASVLPSVFSLRNGGKRRTKRNNKRKKIKRTTLRIRT